MTEAWAVIFTVAVQAIYFGITSAGLNTLSAHHQQLDFDGKVTAFFKKIFCKKRIDPDASNSDVSNHDSKSSSSINHTINNNNINNNNNDRLSKKIKVDISEVNSSNSFSVRPSTCTEMV